jgi:glucose/arabinose dehydrogenase
VINSSRHAAILLFSALGLGWAASAAAQVLSDKQPAATPWGPGMAPVVPAGFSIAAFVRTETSTGWMAVAPNGDVFLSEPLTGNILLLRDTAGRGVADVVTVFASGFSRPHGLMLRGSYLYVVDVPHVWRIRWTRGALTGGKPERVTGEGDFTRAGGGSARDMEFDSRGRRYIGFANAAKLAESRTPDGTVQLIAADGSLSTFASGMQTVVGMAMYPGTDDLFVTGVQREGPGVTGPADYLTRVRRGAFYGALVGGSENSTRRATRPDLLFPTRSFPMEIAFYTGKQFPARYRGGAFVALHGGWGKAPSGYSIAFVKFRARKPEGKIEDFVTGFWDGGKGAAPLQLWGRPAGIAVAPDGSLLIADDIGRTVWRVTYTGR